MTNEDGCIVNMMGLFFTYSEQSSQEGMTVVRHSVTSRRPSHASHKPRGHVATTLVLDNSGALQHTVVSFPSMLLQEVNTDKPARSNIGAA
jgi:hypothetical protein